MPVLTKSSEEKRHTEADGKVDCATQCVLQISE